MAKNPRKLIVIGGSAAGPKAASKARRLDQEAEITIIQKDHDLSMASCGYPYYIGGVFQDRTQLLGPGGGVVRDTMYYRNAKDITTKVDTEATTIDREAKTVTCKNLVTNDVEILAYDKLVLATGSVPTIPNIPGKDLKGVTALKSMEDVDFLRKVAEEKGIKQAVVIGGGLIGIETCEALSLSGVKVTIVELLSQILTFLDWQLAKILENYVRSKGVDVITNNGIARFLGSNGVVTGVGLSDGTELPCELAVVAVGVKPNVDLARRAGLEIGKTGGIIADPYMQTSDPHIYAVGDCTEQQHLITGHQIHAPLGDLANLEGRVAGENAILGNRATFSGTILSGVCKVFDQAAGSTGLSESKARELGFDVTSVVIAGLDKPGYMNGQFLISKMVVENKSQKIVGFQCIGPGDVSKQVAQAAMAIQGKMTVNDLTHLDLPYAPPFTLAIDNFIACSHVVENKIKGRMKGVSAEEVKRRVDAKDDMYVLDVRGPDEFEAMRLGIGETLIPLGMLRKRIGELPADKNREIITYCKISLRAYEAQLILESHGWTNVKIMEGGVMAWPYPREK